MLPLTFPCPAKGNIDSEASAVIYMTFTLLTSWTADVLADSVSVKTHKKCS